jgi:siroheme synthase
MKLINWSNSNNNDKAILMYIRVYSSKTIADELLDHGYPGRKTVIRWAVPTNDDQKLPPEKS